jgi:hypothetical protein
MIPPSLASRFIIYQASSAVTTFLSVGVGVIAVLITAAGAIGAWAALRVARNSQVTANYRATAESWESLATSLTAEKAELEHRLEDATVMIAGLNTKVATLQELATGHPEIERLSKSMNSSFRALADQMSRIEKSLKGAANGGATV